MIVGLIASIAAPSSAVPESKIRYVNAMADDCDTPDQSGEYGRSWERPYCEFQDAVREGFVTDGQGVLIVDEIWVAGAAGYRYRPDQGENVWIIEGDRSKMFALNDSLRVYGGFAGDEERRAKCVGGTVPPETECWEAADCGGGHCKDLRDFGYCIEGANAGKACSFNADCPSSECKNVTILSGDLVGNDEPDFQYRDDNSYNVVQATSDTTTGRTIDGFTITGGYADGYEHAWQHIGGGVVAWKGSITIRNCRIVDNWAATRGGGIGADDDAVPQPNRKVTVVNSYIADNHAGPGIEGEGGGIGYSDKVDLVLMNSQVLRNRAKKGGGVWGVGGQGVGTNSLIANTLIAENTAAHTGGIDGWKYALVNCTVTENVATAGSGTVGGVRLHGEGTGGSSPIVNSIIWGNTGPRAEQIEVLGNVTITYSDVEGGLGGVWKSGTGTLDWDQDHNLLGDAEDYPNFANPASGDYRIANPSNCIDAGDNDALPEDKGDIDADNDTAEKVEADLNMNPRRVDDPDSLDNGNGGELGLPMTDMGAYEYLVDCNTNSIADQCDINCGDDGGVCHVPGCDESIDCNENDVPDECDIADETSTDCDSNSVPDECQPDDDCQANQIQDICDIAGCDGSPWCTDCNGNAIPDGCETTPFPPNLPQDTQHQARKNRYISIDPSTNCQAETAIQVKLTSMKRCTGDNSRTCTADADCPGVCDGDHDIQCSTDTICGSLAPCIPTSPCVEHADVGSFGRKWVSDPFDPSCQSAPGETPSGTCNGTDYVARVVSAAPGLRACLKRVLHA